jgi:hypothetical protein
MLTLESLLSTKDLVATLADKGVMLRPVGQSPIAEAMAATKTWGTRLDCLSDIDKLPGEIYGCNEPRYDGESIRDDVHTAYMEAAAAALGTQLAGHIAYATTVVLPVISDLHDVIKAAQDLDKRCGIRSYTVSMVSGSSLLDVGDIVERIDQFAAVDQRRELPLNLDFKPMGDEEIVGLMKIGAQAYDEAVDTFVSQNGMELIREVWNVVFAGERGGFADYDMFRADRKKGLARNFTVFLIATKLLIDLDKMPDVTGLSGLSSSKYGMILKSLQEVSGAALYATVLTQRHMEKTGKLIDKVDGKVVYVNKSVYDRFMAEGGDIETILGSVVSGNKALFVSEINEKVELFKQAWNYHVTQDKMNNASSELIDVRLAMDTFTRQFVRTTDDATVTANRDAIINRSRSFLESTYAPALKEVDMLAMRFVCEVIFSHTDALKVLCGVNEAMIANPAISKEDALNLSVTAYVADWFASQIEIDQ